MTVYNQNFLYYCIGGELNEAKMLLVKHPEIDIHYACDSPFRYSCDKGQLHVAKWLFEVGGTKISQASSCSAFRYSCEQGRLEVAKWLAEIFDFSTKCMRAEFSSSCYFGHLEVAKWLAETYPAQIDLNSVGEIPYNLDSIRVVEWMVEKYPKIYINPEVFCRECARGNFEIVKRLAKLPFVKNVSYELAFFQACKHGRLDVAKWLVETFPKLDVHDFNDSAYKGAVADGHVDVVRWFLETYPETLVQSWNGC